MKVYYATATALIILMLLLLLQSLWVEEIPKALKEEPTVEEPVREEMLLTDVSVSEEQVEVITPTPVFSVSPYDRLVKKYARQYGFDWLLISAQIYAESSFRADAVSPVGARGLMQVMPSTARDSDIDPDTLFTPEVSISFGCYYDSRQYHRVGEVDSENDRLAMMLASYNCGGGRVSRIRRQVGNGSWTSIRDQLPKETQGYVPKIFRKYDEYRSRLGG